jgi:hypothetical protein
VNRLCAPHTLVQNLPGPVPKPDWFWPWVRWYLGVGEFERLAQKDSVRPDEAPNVIPDWAWATLRKLVAEREARGSIG